MKTLKTLIASLLFLIAPAMFAQTILSNTTLSTAVTFTGGPNGRTVQIASATCNGCPGSTITIPSTGQTYLWVDKELMDVQGVSGTVITVVRGAEGTQATTHASGALVFVIPASKATFFKTYPTGSCTRSNELALPRIHYSDGIISDCLGGQWINGDASQTTRSTYANLQAPPTGGTIYTSLNSTGTTLSATLMYCTEIDLPFSKLVTGLGVLNGTTATTDNHLIAIYDATGNLIANSATAGVLAATASEYQNISLTAKYYFPGPVQLFGCLQTNGTTATVRMLVTQTTDTYLTKSFTDVFGTIPATITVPTTFTTAVGPYYTVF